MTSLAAGHCRSTYPHYAHTGFAPEHLPTTFTGIIPPGRDATPLRALAIYAGLAAQRQNMDGNRSAVRGGSLFGW